MIRPPPLPLNYGRVGPPPGGYVPAWLGILAGLLFSGVFWGIGFLCNFLGQDGNGVMLWTVFLVVAKASAFAVAMSKPRWRRFGIGLLISIGVALLIFVCTCFAVLAVALNGSHH
jgi:hypothetical protein